MDNQRKFLEDHGVKIQEIENVITKFTAEQDEKEKQTAGKVKGKINFFSVNGRFSLENWKD